MFVWETGKLCNCNFWKAEYIAGSVANYCKVVLPGHTVATASDELDEDKVLHYS